MRRFSLTAPGTPLKTSAAALALALSLAACGTDTTTAGTTTTNTTDTTVSSSTATTSTATADDAAADNSSATTTDTTAVVAADATAITEDTHYDADDLTWDPAEEVAVTLADDASGATGDGVAVDGNTITITAAGTYRLSGELTDGQVVVAAGEEDVVRVILDGVELTSSTGSPFVVTSANEAMVYLENGSTNTLTDADTYADTGTDAPNATLYSMADLTIAGAGDLTVNGNTNNAITSKDGLVLASGNVTVNAVDDGIEGKDYIAFLGGTYDVTAGGDGVKSTNEDEEERGWFTVYGGQLVVSSGDDAVKAATTLTVNAGTVTVTDSVEGLEAQHITINGGTVDVTSTDDGVNASGASTATTSSSDGAMGGSMGGGMGGGPGGGMEAAGDYSVTVTGGTLTINSDGDGLASNGDASITGGTVVVNGPTNDGNGALDVNGELTVDGGTVAAAGSSGMAVTPGTASTQSGVQITFGTAVPAGTALQIASSDGTVVGAFVTSKEVASLVFSSASITDGETYTVYTGGTTTATEGITEGTLDGAEELGTVTAGDYTQSTGPGPR